MPVINGALAGAHPCQALADLLTIRERFGTLEGLRLAYVGDGRNNVAASLAEAAAMAGVSMTFGCPATHRPPTLSSGQLVELGQGAQRYGARVHESGARRQGGRRRLHGRVDVDGRRAIRERNAAALLAYQVDSKLMKAAAPHAIFMHCLPRIAARKSPTR